MLDLRSTLFLRLSLARRALGPEHLTHQHPHDASASPKSYQQQVKPQWRCGTKSSNSQRSTGLPAR
eukprot:scaffold7397_cov277-Pinguiococcus_pyrenoidosus.AAC.2